MASRKNSFLGNSIEFFTKKPETFLTTTLVGNNIVNVLYATFMAIFLVEPIQIYFEAWFGIIPSELQILLIQTVIAAVVIMLFGEILPKAIFRALADNMIAVISVPLRIAYYLFRPLIEISRGSSNILIKFLVKDAEVPENYYRRQDVEMIFKELRDSGGSQDIDEDDSEILHNVLELSSKRVKDSMIPGSKLKPLRKIRLLKKS